MAIEKFEEALKQYIQEETQKMKDISVAALEGMITEDSIKAAARLLDHQDAMAIGIVHRLENAMIDLTRHLEKEGYGLPPASILAPEKFTDEESSEIEYPVVEFQPQYSFSRDLLEISDEDKENYGIIIDNALLTDSSEALGSIFLGEGQKTKDVKRKMLNAGISLNHRITFPDINKSTRPKNQLPFEVSDLLPHFTYDNVVLLRNNLGNIKAFNHLPSEVLSGLLENLNLEIRTSNCLIRSQFRCVSEVLQTDEVNIGGLRNFGEGGFHDLIVTFAANKILPEAKS